MPEPTRKQIEKFVKVRADSLPSNLQFGFDARECGFDVKDLPTVEKTPDGAYVWTLSHGRLIETTWEGIWYEPK